MSGPPALRPRPAGSAEPAPPFVPIAEVARNEAPRATIDPDKSLTWLRRVLPIMRRPQGDLHHLAGPRRSSGWSSRSRSPTC